MSFEAAIRGIVREEIRAALRELAPNRSTAATDYVSTRDAARTAGVSPKTIRRWQDEEKLGIYWAGRERRVSLLELQRFMSLGPKTDPQVDLKQMAREMLNEGH